jgi:hypothetical protein
MNDVLQEFLSPRLPIGGVVAYSVQSPDQVLAVECFSKSFYNSAAENLLSRVVHAGRTLLPAADCAASYCWSFESLQVYVAARADGACLALLVENGPGAQLLRIQETLQAFVDLPEL